MAISIHLVSIPEQEAVASRIVHLPEEGGVIGRSPDCDVVLPDHSSRISRKHAAITLTNDGYFIQDLSRNGINLNDKSVQGGLQLPINDGDIIAIADYSLLVSTLTTSKAAVVNKEVDVDTLSFNIDASDEVDFLETSTLSSIQVEPMTNDFSTQNVLAEDPFSSDPFDGFEQEEISRFEEPINNVQHVNFSEESVPSSTIEFVPMNRENDDITSSLQQLIALSKENQSLLQNPPFQHDQLFTALEQTIEQFLDEFCPEQLESQFNEYVGNSLFVNKEKRYWRIYRKTFERRQKNGDFRRQFKALFIENMQRGGED
ncbi:FHA domain-containing protein [Vibrio mediterranei]|uniref:FHA domain-containing protein n=1 Tax=Vibrio mediterranei TaxID=689 RepID=A0AAN1KP56_9VIBR|nr:FHA domain-containing protein [Vibrio mediterranei]ASI91138.1 hypothetical protein BSZ05_15750 [Vibrio mediterranei]